MAQRAKRSTFVERHTTSRALHVSNDPHAPKVISPTSESSGMRFRVCCSESFSGRCGCGIGIGCRVWVRMSEAPNLQLVHLFLI